MKMNNNEQEENKRKNKKWQLKENRKHPYRNKAKARACQVNGCFG